MSLKQKSGFYFHLKEAIEVNSERSRYYASQTDDRSRYLSLYLVSMERLILPLAWYYDTKAKKFNEQGIGIIKDDFVSMQNVSTMQAKPIYGATLTQEAFKNLKIRTNKYLKSVKQHNKKSDFASVAKETHSFIKKLQVEEKKLEVHFAMSIHILESVCFFAQNSVIYVQQSEGKTSSLSRSFITFQLLGLGSALYLDRWAQGFHREGVGIILNDMPAIPCSLKENHEV